MKKITKIISLVLCLSVLAFCFAACSSDNKGATKTTDDANDAAKTQGVLKMATNAAFPPYEYKEGEEFVGIDVEIAEAICEKLGYELEIVDMEFDSVITSVIKGETDFGMSGITVTDERKKEVDFTSSYATGIQSVIVVEGSDVKSLDDLEGIKIGVQKGTTGALYASDDYGEENVINYATGADAVIALKGGDVQAVIIDNEPAHAFANENEGLKVLDTDYAVEDYAICIQKGNEDLVNKFNEALDELISEGKVDEIISKFIGA